MTDPHIERMAEIRQAASSEIVREAALRFRAVVRAHLSSMPVDTQRIIEAADADLVQRINAAPKIPPSRIET